MTVFIFGEAMLEYHSHGGTDALRYGGDTLNTAIHMARMGQDVAYVTAVGTDPISDALVAEWASEGIDTRYVLRHPTRSPGIYAIHVDAKGERSFLYWRERSAAREMFHLPDMADILAAAQNASLLYYSLISLAILPDDGRDQLLKLAANVRSAGRAVAYDSNFRPSLWDDMESARARSVEAIASASIGLPTNDDEQRLHGQTMTDAAIAKQWLEGGCKEVVVKAGGKGCLFSATNEPDQHFPVDRIEPMDSSGAGDAFNAGFLSARLDGADPSSAIKRGQEFALWNISRNGAIPALDISTPYCV